MASVAPAAEQATDLLQKMTLEPKSKPHDVVEVTKKYGSANVIEVKSAPVQSSDRSVTPLLQNVDPNMCYFAPYYYGGYNGSAHEWGEDYSRYMNPDGMEMPTGVYGDVYHSGYGYPPYGAYPSPGSPVPTMGHDGQLYAPQHYQYQTSYYQPPATPSAPYTSSKVPTSKSEISTSAASDQPPIPLDTSKVNANGVANGSVNGNKLSAPQKLNQQKISLASNGSYGRGSLPNGIPSSGYLGSSFDGMRSPVPWYDGAVYPDTQHRLTPNNAVSSTQHVANSTSGRNQNVRPVPHLMGLHNTRPISEIGPAAPGMINRMYPNNRMYSSFNTSLGFRSNFYDSRTNGRWGPVNDSKYKPRGQSNGFYGYGSESLDGLSELNRGPRANYRLKNLKVSGPTVPTPVKGQCLPTDGKVGEPAVPDKDQYNQADFCDKYEDAKFFIIKSYSEDDIHKSIKYNVWASTPNGNKKLDAGYQEAHKKAGGCPVFLFFSVNTSGQFVGVAEMVGPVDFDKTVGYWQQDKWNGCFSVKWHIVKDVPNNILKHITLENNDNKPVTNSRDTQEVKLEQGLQMLKLFKEHVSKTSILDDFAFYESREKVMQEKRVKQQQLHKQIADAKPTDTKDEKDKDNASVKSMVQKPLLDVVTVLKKEVTSVGVEEKQSEESGATSVASTVDAPKGSKIATEKKTVANGVANGC